jgi:putative alpha-1,2-mannosidase
LNSGVTADMTAAQHTSLFRFTFPDQSLSPLILLDLTDLSDSRQDNASISVDATTGRMTGNGRFKPSFGQGNYVTYFCADFKGPRLRDNGIYVNSRGNASVKDLEISRGINSAPLPGGAFNRFTSSAPVTVRVGLSFRSSDQACSIAEAEIPDFDFETTHNAAAVAWRSKLSPITVSTSGVDTSLITNFYSGIYRTMVNPQNYTGVNPIVSDDEIWFDSFYW